MSSLIAAAAPIVEDNLGEQLVFWVCATFAVVGALGMVVSRKAVHSALFIAMTMVNLAILYVSQQALFLGLVQVIVYTGAVMMLFLFVLMIVGVDSSDSLVETIKGQRWAALGFGLGFAVLLIAGVGNAIVSPSVGLDTVNSSDGGNVQAIATLIFGRYVLVFELTAGLLISAALGAMVLAHRERWTPRLTQPELSRARFLGSGPKAPLPAPGVYARRNAVDTPALLPDGTVSEISIPGPLRARGSVRPLDTESVAEIDEINEGHVAITGEEADVR